MFADLVSKTSLDMYKNLNKAGKPTNNEWTVLTTILLDFNNKLDVVALGTGTKCIGKLQMMSQGIILNDSHAEIICRRAFLRYLYNEMLEEKSNILERNKNGKLYQLRKGVKFHMYSTLMPCGDASIFPKLNDTTHEMSEYGEVVEFSTYGNNRNDKTTYVPDSGERVDEHIPSKRIKHDIHRTGAKCLPNDDKSDLKSCGSGYHVLGAVRTKPGRGHPTLSASCSDKLAKWIHMGLQGSLISLLVEEPIYLSSITIGNYCYNKEALERALHNRFIDKTLSPINLKYKVNIPEIFQSTLHEFAAQKCDNKQPCPSSIIYTRNRKVEVAVEGLKQGTTKKNRFSSSGRLTTCKLELFKAFLQVANKIKLNNEHCTYKALKSSTEYVKYWTIVKNEKFLVWPVKDPSFEDFFANS